MSYLVLARKWRPNTFADLVGQEHVVQTLSNAIVLNRVAHAFLFTGARGVGKTTIARILAKALNCLDRDGVSTEPCLRCAACTEIALGRDPDVTEIDGASNTSVDDVRRLQESLPYRPSRDRHKIVIIDEVHMLSNSAFNALLKTLEEPPPHVKFIFATTEVHKLPITVLSRCQRYDFRLIPSPLIRARLATILDEEKIPHDAAALSLIAREAAGSLRDALSLLDQVLAGTDGDLTGSAAAALLGVADHKILYDLARAILQGNASLTLTTLDAIATEGFDLANISKNLLGVLRDLVIARVVSDPKPLLDLADDELTDTIALAQAHSALDLERLFTAWARVTEDVSRAREPRWVLEMGAVRLAHRPTLLPAEDLLSRLADLERRLSSNSPPPPSSPPSPSSKTPSSSSSPAPRRAPASTSTSSSPSGSTAAAVTTAVTAPAASPDWLSSVRPRTQRNDPNRAVAPASPTLSPTPSTKPSAPLLDISAAPAAMPAWRALVDTLDHPLVSIFKVAVPLRVDGTTVRIAIDSSSSFILKKLSTPEAQTLIADAAEKLFGSRPSIDLVQAPLPEHPPTLALAEETARNTARQLREQTVRNHPSVLAVCEILRGEVVKVRFDDDTE